MKGQHFFEKFGLRNKELLGHCSDCLDNHLSKLPYCIFHCRQNTCVWRKSKVLLINPARCCNTVDTRSTWLLQGSSTTLDSGLSRSGSPLTQCPWQNRLMGSVSLIPIHILRFPLASWDCLEMKQHSKAPLVALNKS